MFTADLQNSRRAAKDSLSGGWHGWSCYGSLGSVFGEQEHVARWNPLFSGRLLGVMVLTVGFVVLYLEKTSEQTRNP